MNLPLGVTNKLYHELWIQTDKTSGEIASVIYAVMESMKGTGQSLNTIEKALNVLEQHKVIERTNRVSYKMTDKGFSIQSDDDLERALH